jgi:DNA-binding NtrC family response regulator
MCGRILVVDDDQSMCEWIAADLRLRGWDSAWHTSAAEALAALKSESFDVVLTDLRMPGLDGLGLCERSVASRPEVPVVVLTAFGSLETAVAAIRAGAYDFVTKPIEMEVLALSLERALQHRRLCAQVQTLSEAIAQSRRFEDLLGESPPMRELYDQVARIADSEASVLITGESGTGKELVARALHQHSRRQAGPLVAINCAGLPETLLESELFGHAQGAFTDARTARRGLFLEAENGTLLLDEIGDFPLSLQPKLLRALEQRTVRPVGSNTEVPFNARVLATTNRDLDAAVEEGRFREDLMFRINVIHLQLPPLRCRGNDVLLLAQHFVEQVARRSQKRVTGLSKPVAEKLLAYPWPGNVRELRNAMERAVALTSHETLGPDDLPERIRDCRATQLLVGSDDPRELATLEEMERRYILHVLRAVGGNRGLAAQVLAVDPKTLYRKLRRYEAASKE